MKINAPASQDRGNGRGIGNALNNGVQKIAAYLLVAMFARWAMLVGKRLDLD